MDDPVCFYCLEGPASACPGCSDIFACKPDHLAIHRHLEECLPWTVGEVEGKGRVVIATRDIKPRQTIIVDTPAIVGPFDDASSLLSLCLECTNRVEEGGGHPCKHCGLILCSSACEGGPVHAAECQVLSKADPRLQPNEDGVFSAISPLRMLAVKQQKPEIWDRVARLMDHLEERRAEDKWRYVTDVVLPLITKRCSVNKEEGDEELMESIIGIFRTNSVKWEREKEEGGLIPVGHALLPVFSLLSHSCVNNTRYTQTRDGRMIVRAVKPICKGEEVTTQYRGPNEGNVVRQLEIPQNWMFECSCQRCQDPTELGTHASTMVCPACGVPALLPTTSKPGEPVWECVACNEQQSRSYILEVVKRLEKQLETLPYSCDPPEWEALLLHFNKELHPDHFLCMKVKRLLLQLYGSREGYRLEQLPRSLIDRKIELCRNYIKVFSLLEPGFRLWRGRVLEELLGPLGLAVNQDMEEGKLGKIDYILRYKEIMTMMKEAAQCRQFDELRTGDGMVGQFYKSIMAPVENAAKE